MTQAEFAKGWKLLILQPWGWRYRSLTEQGAPSEESRTQMEFYYDKLKFGHPDAWMKVAGSYAEGEKWPSVESLRSSLSHANNRYMPSLPPPSGGFEPPPKEVQEMIDKFLGRSM